VVRVEYVGPAERELYRLPRPIVVAFETAFLELSDRPFDSGSGYRVKPLRETGGRWVVRIGSYGAIYRVEGNTLRVLKVGPRSTLYRPRR
jgi:mRNA-degrading endonuclease RelE of RelBE toxin-antitoxin system